MPHSLLGLMITLLSFRTRIRCLHDFTMRIPRHVGDGTLKWWVLFRVTSRETWLGLEIPLNKSELTTEIATKTGLTNTKAAEVVNAVFDTITAQLVSGDGKVTIQGFGTFLVKDRAARNGVNPNTGETIQIPAKKACKFTAGSTLKF